MPVQERTASEAILFIPNRAKSKCMIQLLGREKEVKV
jgi:hypothetical protein